MTEQSDTTEPQQQPPPMDFNQLLQQNENTSMRVGKVDIKGYVFTNPDIFKPAVDKLLKAETLGEIMNGVDGLSQYLTRLNIFKNVEAELDVSKDHRGEVELTLNVKERGRIGVTTGTQFGQQEANTAVSGILRNFLGRGESLSGTYSLGTKTNTLYNLTFTEPLYDDTKSFDINAFKLTNNHQLASSVHELVTGMSVNFKQWTQLATHHVNYTLHWREIFNATNKASWATRRETGHSIKSSLAYTLTHDRRDNLSLPSRGYYLTSTQEYAGVVTGVQFFKTQSEARCYFPLIGSLVFGGTLQGGLLYPLGGKASCHSDRIFMGGPLSLRGFTMKGVGPREGADSLGGDLQYALGGSIRTPLQFLHPSLGSWLQLQAFANVGNLTEYNQAITMKENVIKLITAQPRTSVG
eukprot:Ihof_evm11s3 gene=Ihof_evmTU11s3